MWHVKQIFPHIDLTLIGYLLNFLYNYKTTNLLCFWDKLTERVQKCKFPKFERFYFSSSFNWKLRIFFGKRLKHDKWGSKFHNFTYVAVCEFSHKSDANGLWNLLGTCEIWHMRSPTGLWQFFQLWLLFLTNKHILFYYCVTLILFSVICRDRCDWSKKRVALPSNKSLAFEFFTTVLSVEIFFFVSAMLIGQFDGILCIGIFD